MRTRSAPSLVLVMLALHLVIPLGEYLPRAFGGYRSLGPIGRLPEELFAWGRRASFREIELGDLILIPGISDTLAERLIEQRNEVLSKASTLRAADQHHALELVRGIGPLTAGILDGFLDLGPPGIRAIERPSKRTKVYRKGG